MKIFKKFYPSLIGKSIFQQTKIKRNYVSSKYDTLISIRISMNNINLLTPKETEFNNKIQQENLSNNEINEYFNEYIKNEYYKSYLISRNFIINCCLKLNDNQLFQLRDCLFLLLSKSNERKGNSVDIDEKEKKKISSDQFSVDKENRDDNYIFIINITNFLLSVSQKQNINKNFLTDEQVVLYEELYIKYSIFLSYKETIKLFSFLRGDRRFSKNIINIYQNVILDYSESKFSLERFAFMYYLLPDIVFMFSTETLNKLFNIIINDIETNQVPLDIIDTMVKKLMITSCLELFYKKNVIGSFCSLCNAIKSYYIEKIVTFNYVPHYIISFFLICVLSNVNKIFISDIHDIPDKKNMLFDEIIVEYIINSSAYTLTHLSLSLFIFLYYDVKENKVYLVDRIYKSIEDKILSKLNESGDNYFGLSCLLIMLSITKIQKINMIHKNIINHTAKYLLLEYFSLIDNYKPQQAKALFKHIIALIVCSSKVQMLSDENVELLNLILPDREFLFNVSNENGNLIMMTNKNKFDEERKEEEENLEEKDGIVDDIVDEKEDIVDEKDEIINEKEEIVEVEMLNNRI